MYNICGASFYSLIIALLMSFTSKSVLVFGASDPASEHEMRMNSIITLINESEYRSKILSLLNADLTSFTRKNNCYCRYLECNV